MADAGYSGTPLVRKLGIRPGDRVRVVDDPGHAGELLAGLPDGASVASGLGAAEIVLAFVSSRERLADVVPELGAAIFPAGACWVAWPKRASGVVTDVTEDVVRETALPLGLVDTKVCAVDETWSGLRLVWRREHRSRPPSPPRPPHPAA
jgi:hypothetical protein